MLPLALVLTIGCGPKPPPEDVMEGLPEWMTHGEQVRLDIANKLLESGNTLGALDIVRQMRAEGYTSPELDLLQGKALRLDGVTSEAERLLLAAQKKLPRDARAPAELCILYADERPPRLEEAIEKCQRAADLDDKNAQAYNNLSYLLLASDRLDEAKAAAEHAVELDGTEPRYRNNLALVQAARGQQDVAFRTFHSTMPKSEAAYMVGLAVERFFDFEAARMWYERALEYDANHTGAQQKLQAPTDGAGSAPVEEQ